MSIVKRLFGKTPKGEDVFTYELSNTKGMSVNIIDFGAIIVSINVLDKEGKLKDIVLGYDKLEGYMKQGPYFGAIIGRYANRIAKGSFTLNGEKYGLAINNGKNHLHGGIKGFDKVLWKAEILSMPKEALELSYLSKDMEEGYPGNLNVRVTYMLTEDNELKIEYYAVSDKDTIVNLTNHSYFNLAGHNAEKILEHKVMINADYFTPADKDSIPTGEIKAVKNTPMDFTRLKKVGEGICENYGQINFAEGYDHNWIINRIGDGLVKAAEVIEENSGRSMEVYTTKPGVQFYTANFLDSKECGPGKEGARYERYGALCLETQYYPDSINKENFPSPILRANEEYKHCTVYKFSTV